MTWGLLRRSLFVGLAWAASACSAPAPSPEILPDGGKLVARFGEARAVETDGAGRLYVVDAAVSEVIVMDTSGVVLDRLGGTEDQAFLDVTDVDPTNGQSIFIADAGTGRIVRFTAEGRAVETIAVPRGLDVGSPARAEGARQRVGEGRPVAVAAGPGNVLYAIEAERGLVLRWDADRTLDRVLGGPASPMPLRAPSALAVSGDGSLLVADGSTLLGFDPYGAFWASMDAEALGVDLHISISDGRALFIGAKSIAGIEKGDIGLPIPFDLGEPLVDAVLIHSGLYLLTRTRLVRVPVENSTW